MKFRHYSFLALLGACVPAFAGNVALVGVIGRQAAILAADGGAPKVVRIGDRWNGVKVLSVREDRAVVEIDGRRQVLLRGLYSQGAGPGAQSVTLSADDRGHFFGEGAVDGRPVRFIVDTGATLVSLPASLATQLGIDYLKAPRGVVETAAGRSLAYRVTLDSVKLGAIELKSVDAIVMDHGPDLALLGMSFLNRVQMKRDGDSMVLVRRY